MERMAAPLQTCDLSAGSTGTLNTLETSGPLAACVVGSTSYQEATELVNAIELTNSDSNIVLPKVTCGPGTVTSFSEIQRFLISFLDMVAYVRQQYNEGNLSSSTCQCVLAQLCARFLNAVFPSSSSSPSPPNPSKSLAYLLATVLNHAPLSKPSNSNGTNGTNNTGNTGNTTSSPKLINNVLLMANVMQVPIDWATLQASCGLDASTVCTILTYATPGLLQSSLSEFSMCGTSGVPFTLATMTSIPNQFIDPSQGCQIACGEWLSEFQKDADNCEDYVKDLFNYSSPSKVASNICQANGIFLGQSPSPNDQSTCTAMFSSSLSNLINSATACCKSSKSASRQKGLRWFLLGLGIACAILLLVGVAGLFKKLSVLSKKNTISTVYAAKTQATSS